MNDKTVFFKGNPRTIPETYPPVEVADITGDESPDESTGVNEVG